LDDTALVDDLRVISSTAADRYLEHAVVGKKSPSKHLHVDLLTRLLDAAGEEVKDDGVKYHLEELGESSPLPIGDIDEQFCYEGGPVYFC
jgi:hypothetical protein